MNIDPNGNFKVLKSAKEGISREYCLEMQIAQHGVIMFDNFNITQEPDIVIPDQIPCKNIITFKSSSNKQIKQSS